MSKRRKNQFREALDAKREALTRAATEPAGTGQNMVDIINVTRQSIGPNRGDVEGALSYLASLVNQYQEPAAVTEEAGVA
jgi:hypothetical protein